jgi:hypothetical protein
MYECHNQLDKHLGLLYILLCHHHSNHSIMNLSLTPHYCFILVVTIDLINMSKNIDIFSICFLTLTNQSKD